MKKYGSLLITILLIFCFFININVIDPNTSMAASSKNFVIYLYPGHSPATSAKFEATLNERVTIKLYHELVSRGYTVYITNPMALDSSLPHILTEGPVNDAGKPGSQYHFGTQLLPAINTPEKYDPNIPKADLCIGIHHNAENGYSIDNPTGSANGYEIYYSSTLTADYGKNSRTVTYSRDMANALDKQLNHDFYLNRRSGAVKDADVNSVTTRSKVPSILLEAGFMTNAYDSSQITKDSNMDILADRIANAVDAYAPTHTYIDNSAPILQSINPANGSCVSNIFTIFAMDVKDDKSGVASVEFAVWSANNGQDDLKIYEGTDITNGNWRATIDISNHRNDTGIYYCDVYGTDKMGNRAYLGQCNVIVDLAGPTIGSVSPTSESEVTSPFTVTAKDVQDPAGVSYVQFAVWSSNSGQDDLASYYVYDGSDGGWSTSIDISKHKNDTGKYFVDVYACDKLGNRSYYGQTILNVGKDTVGPTIGSVSPTSGSEVTSPFTVTAKDVQDPAGVSYVQFAVWSSNSGQDDLASYYVYDGSDGGWSTSIDISKHKNDTGKYFVDVYACDKLGNRSYYGQTVVSVKDTFGPTIGSVSPTSGSEVTSPFTVTAKDVQDPAGVSYVQFAVWSSNSGQDDLASYYVYDGERWWLVHFY